MTNLPALFTCFEPTSASASSSFEHSDFFNSDAAARASAMPPFDKERAPAFIALMAFIAFMAFIAAIDQTAEKRNTKQAESNNNLSHRPSTKSA